MKNPITAVLWEPLPIPPRIWRRFNELLWRVWIGLTIFTFTSGLSDSIPWLAFMSGYAIIASHLSASRSDAPDDDHAEGAH